MFKKLDLFPSQVSLKFKHQNLFYSTLGGLLTIIIILITIALIVTTGKRFYLRVSPTIGETNIFNNTASNYTFGGDNQLVFYVNCFSLDLTKTDLLDINIYRYIKHVVEGKTVIERKKLKTEACANNYDTNIGMLLNLGVPEQNIIDNRFNSSICISREEYENHITLGGIYNTNFFSNIYVELKKCLPDKNKKCTEKRLLEEVHGANIEVFYVQSIFNIANYTKPDFSTMKSYYVKLSLFSFTQSDINFKSTTLVSDTGIIFDKVNNITKWGLDYARDQNVELKNGDNLLLRTYLMISQNSSFIYRNYMKIQELLAYIGGILKILILVASGICSFFNKYLFEEEMINTFFIESDDVITKKFNEFKSTLSINIKKQLKNNIHEDSSTEVNKQNENANHNNLKEIEQKTANNKKSISKLFNKQKLSCNKNTDSLKEPTINSQKIIKTNNQDSSIIQKNNEISNFEERNNNKENNFEDITDKSLKDSSDQAKKEDSSSDLANSMLYLRKSLRFDKKHNSKSNTFYHVNYSSILGMSIFPCLKIYKSMLDKHGAYVKQLYKISDYEEVVSEMALFREYREFKCKLLV